MLPLYLLALVITGLSAYWFVLVDELYHERAQKHSLGTWLSFHSKLVFRRMKTDPPHVVDLLRRIHLTAHFLLLCMVLFIGALGMVPLL